MPSPLKLLSTDFDGTLFAEFEDPPIPRGLEDLLDSLQTDGAKWVINTGRDMSSLMESLARAGVSVIPDYLVLVEREIHVRHASQYVSLEEWNGPCNQLHAELFTRIRADLPRLAGWIQDRFHATLYEDAYSPLCLIARSNGEMDSIHQHLEEYCRTVPRLSVVRNDVYARFCHDAYNKGTALAEVARRLGLNAHQTFAAGDHLNDLPMLSRNYAECLAAPANAIPVVREAVRRQGGYLSPSPHGLGVAEAIKYYLADRAGRTLTFNNDRTRIKSNN
ncbi:MAG TPA: HAD hydrolase family protein [Candidatus Acidoferrum sp.]|nr:HAD hydrolase family protein [Candidatus Acidoferrum sp.]